MPGETQVFFTSGIGFGRVHLNNHLRFSSAFGIQTAVTKFHTYSHRWMYSLRLSF